MTTILLTGVTGKVSGATLEALRGTGHRLIGLVRDPGKAESLGIELRHGDLERPRSLEGVFEGVDAAWLLAPPGPLAPYQMSNALHAAREAGVRHVVRMSAVGAAHDAPTLNSRMHALSDTELALSGIAFTVLKPHFFTQNLAFLTQSVFAEGKLYLALADARVPMVDVRDIGAVAARILAEPEPHAGRSYTLTGPSAVSMAEVARSFGAALGREVKYVAVPVSAAVEGMTRMGMDDYGQVAMRDYFTAYSRGWQSEVTSEVERLTGTRARGVEQFVRELVTSAPGA